jgi:hypothetical protein
VANTNDFLSKILGSQNELPPVPLRNDYKPQQEDPYAESPEDNMPALESAPRALASQADIAKMAQYPVAPAEQRPGTEDDELTQHLDAMGKNNSNRLDQELSDSDAMQSPYASEGMPGEPTQAQKMAQQLSTYQQLKNAQNTARSNNANLGILGGFNKIAQGVATGFGGKIDDNEAGVKQLMALNEQPVTDLMNRYKLGGDEANDPQSDISKFARTQAVNVMSTRAGKVDPAEQAKYEHAFDNMSAAQLEKLGFKNMISNRLSAGRQGFTNIRGLLVNGHPLDQEPSTGQYYDGITHQPVDPSKDLITSAVARKDALDDTYKMTPTTAPLMGAKSGSVKPSGKTTETTVDPETGDEVEQKEYTLDDLNKAQIKNYDKIVVPTMKAVKKDKSVEFARKINNAATLVLKKLEPLDPNDPNPKVDSGVAEALAAQYATMATGAAPAEGTISHLRGTGGLMNKLDRIVADASQGSMTQADIQFFKSAAYKFAAGAAQDAKDASQTYIDNIKSAYPDLNLSDDNVAKMLGITSLTKNTTVDKAKAKDAAKDKPKAGMVRFQDSNGYFHDIPEKNLDAAKKRDPGLKVVGQ